MVVGARDEKDQGQVLLFSNDTLFEEGKQWRSEYKVLGKTDDKNVYMWECPDFFPISDDNEFALVFHHKENALKVINTVICFKPVH